MSKPTRVKRSKPAAAAPDPEAAAWREREARLPKNVQLWSTAFVNRTTPPEPPQVLHGRFVVAYGQVERALPYLGLSFARAEDALSELAEMVRSGVFISGLYDLESSTPHKPLRFTLRARITDKVAPSRRTQAQIAERIARHWQSWESYEGYGGRRLHRTPRRFMVQWGWGMGSNETRYFAKLADALRFAATPRFTKGPGVYGITDFGGVRKRHLNLRHTASAKIAGRVVEGSFTGR